MKLNLGCGPDKRPGYVNVDFRGSFLPDVQCDLSIFPWPWRDGSADEILMLDVLEHFSYRLTDKVLQEAWRVLKDGGTLEVQVPDLEHCARAASNVRPYLCNRCGWEFSKNDGSVDFPVCGMCKQSWTDVALAATHRLFGGQDYEGNFHYACFSKPLLDRLLSTNGFRDVEFLERNERGETYHQNWNIKTRAKKGDLWE